MDSRSGNGQARPWMREMRLLNGSLASSGNLAAWYALMKSQRHDTRPTDPHYATGFNVKFPDACPYLLISEVQP
ncbi:hypothetical protein HanPSC8_Chr17g0795221 [Helianthus annuus]|nr:hypothetical protein HanPSC8_Chr17g0795221 [Helianthus annuus]